METDRHIGMDRQVDRYSPGVLNVFLWLETHFIEFWVQPGGCPQTFGHIVYLSVTSDTCDTDRLCFFSHYVTPGEDITLK